MSTVDVSTQQAAFEISRVWVLVSLTILYYDHFLTFPTEVQYFWTRTFSPKDKSISARISWPAILFYTCRYLALVGHIPIVYAAFAHMSPERCWNWQYYHELFTAVSNMLVSALLIMRVYALYERSHKILWFLVVTVVLSAASSTILTTSSEFSAAEPIDPLLLVDGDCKIIIGHVEGYYVAGSWACILVFDTVAFVLTLARTMTLYKSVMIRNSLFSLMLRDGALYFGVLVALYIVNIATLIFSTPDYKGLLITFANALAYVLTGRLMLNIRSSSSLDVGMSDDTISEGNLSLPIVFRSNIPA